MKTEIGQLNLRLPASFEGRAQRISRLVGVDLANRQGLPTGSFAEINIGPLSVDVKSSDRVIATAIAGAIVSALGHHS